MTEKEQKKLRSQIRSLQRLGLPVDEQVLQKIHTKAPANTIKQHKKLS